MRYRRRPIIGITQPTRLLNPGYAILALAVILAGGRPRILTYRKPEPFPDIHGLILGGGRDILPALSRQGSKQNYTYDFKRDSMEITYLGFAESHAIPILGICRGAQLMNIVRDGTLHIHVQRLFQRYAYPTHPLRQLIFRKKICIMPHSLLFHIIDKEKCAINSLHSQAIDRIGHGLTITARDQNGIVQAIEDQTSVFLLGVQFHPEFLLYRGHFRAIFSALIKAAASYQQQLHNY